MLKMLDKLIPVRKITKQNDYYKIIIKKIHEIKILLNLEKFVELKLNFLAIGYNVDLNMTE